MTGRAEVDLNFPFYGSRFFVSGHKVFLQILMDFLQMNVVFICRGRSGCPQERNASQDLSLDVVSQ